MNDTLWYKNAIIYADYLFLALARQCAEPIQRGQSSLPSIPEHAQWANFLRNLDELDLERLTTHEREEVYRTFAPDPAMRIFGRGIRRRLAPMLGDPGTDHLGPPLRMARGTSPGRA